MGLIPGLGRYPEEGNGYPLQYSSLENSMDCTVHGVAKSRTRLRYFHFTLTLIRWNIGVYFFQLYTYVYTHLWYFGCDVFHGKYLQIYKYASACVCARSLVHVWLFVTPWAVACQASSVCEILQARILVAIHFSTRWSPPRDWMCISCISRWIRYHWATEDIQICF